MARATPAGGADNTMDEASSDKVAAIEWSIALTSRLLIKHRSGLHLRRPQVERRLRRILALWLHPALSVTFAWLRRCARQLRRATLSGGPQVRAHDPSSPPPNPEPNPVTKPPHNYDWSVRLCTQHLRSRAAGPCARRSAGPALAGGAMERPMHSPTLQRGLRRWRRHAASQREWRVQRDAWRVAITVLGTARALDRQQGALCRLAAWCRARRARASTLIAASTRLASVRARHATRRWQVRVRVRVRVSNRNRNPNANPNRNPDANPNRNPNANANPNPRHGDLLGAPLHGARTAWL